MVYCQVQFNDEYKNAGIVRGYKFGNIVYLTGSFTTPTAISVDVYMGILVIFHLLLTIIGMEISPFQEGTNSFIEGRSMEPEDYACAILQMIYPNCYIEK